MSIFVFYMYFSAKPNVSTRIFIKLWDDKEFPWKKIQEKNEIEIENIKAKKKLKSRVACIEPKIVVRYFSSTFSLANNGKRYLCSLHHYSYPPKFSKLQNIAVFFNLLLCIVKNTAKLLVTPTNIPRKSKPWHLLHHLYLLHYHLLIHHQFQNTEIHLLLY